MGQKFSKKWVNIFQKKHLIGLVLDLLVTTYRNCLQLDRCTDRLRELNNRELNNSNNRTNENKIKPYLDTEFKKQFIEWR